MMYFSVVFLCLWLVLSLFLIFKAYIATTEEVQDLHKEIEDLKDERGELLQNIELLKQNKGRFPNPDEC